jgi:hypothetical protein
MLARAGVGPVRARLAELQNAGFALPASGEELRLALQAGAVQLGLDQTGLGQTGLGQAGLEKTGNMQSSNALATAALRAWHVSRGGSGEVFGAAMAAAAEESVRRAWREQLALDEEDSRAAYGGWLAVESEGKEKSGVVVARLSAPRAGERGGDAWMTPTRGLLEESAKGLAWYRLHARGGAEEGPDARDRWLAKVSGRAVLVVRQVRAREARVWVVVGERVEDAGVVVLP